MKKYNVTLEFSVDVELDETQFTEEWMQQFREGFYPFTTIEEHVAHLAAQAVFVYPGGLEREEGYDAEAMKIKASVDPRPIDFVTEAKPLSMEWLE